ncbi:LysE family translocator [Vibrio metschnikovii]|uniref:LysE family translocator n=1 Tax=Vibrio metschnikovii TaxID=28172 RepID=UPI001C30CCF5|nr:LysE family translocator [Vibrio metschnikovii]
MTFTFIITLLTICLLGAMSPGPSLAIVVKHSLAGGRLYGILCAWSHACGIFIYALLTISGLSIVFQHYPILFTTISYLGAAYLAYLGIRSLLSKGGIRDKLQSGEQGSVIKAMRDGFAISILSPKIALFFIALFSQFITEGQAGTDKTIIAFMPAIIDGLWYTLIAAIFSSHSVVERIRSKAAIIDKITGLILISLAIKVIFI